VLESEQERLGQVCLNQTGILSRGSERATTGLRPVRRPSNWPRDAIGCVGERIVEKGIY
jgi:hypothetical protein